MNRTIWHYWEQGADALPEVVRLCLRSWRERNPGWQINLLDATSVREAVDTRGLDLDREDMTVQKRANMIRLLLLSQHGGVWADASTYCSTPLDGWLPDVSGAGFFAFRNPSRERLMANWFLYGEPDNVLLQELTTKYVRLFADRTFTRLHDPAANELLRTLSPYFDKDPRGTLFWTSVYALDYLNLHPYFLFHYLFNALVLEDEAMAKEWDRVTYVAARPSFAFLRLGRPGAEPDASRAIANATRDRPPVLKLNWATDTREPQWQQVMNHLDGHLSSAAS